MAKEIELRCAGPDDPIYREGTTMFVGGLWGSKKGEPASSKPSQPTSDGNERGGLDGSVAQGEMQSENESRSTSVLTPAPEMPLWRVCIQI